MKKLAPAIDEVEFVLKEINAGGFWPYLPVEKWQKKHDAVVKAAKAFVKAVNAVHKR